MWRKKILCAKKLVLLTSLQRDRIEVAMTAPSKKEREVNQDEGKQKKKLWLPEELSMQDGLIEEYP
jgi:hypothetical protein